jgi:heme/copper-type cytochrome/quinol oxidase subunit 1
MNIAILCHLVGGSLTAWRTILALLTLGWSLHLASFYLGGLLGVPRRFMTYTPLPGSLAGGGAALASLSILGILIYAAGYLPLLIAMVRRVRG